MILNPTEICMATIVSYALAILALRFYIPMYSSGLHAKRADSTAHNSCMNMSKSALSTIKSPWSAIPKSKLIYILCALNVIFCITISVYSLKMISACSKDVVILWDIDIRDSVVFMACATSLSLLYVLSVLDSLFLFVPNVLLLCVFLCSLVVYYLRSYDVSLLYPFALLGICYIFYFALHIFLSASVMGEGDILVFSSLCILLNALFSNTEMPLLLLIVSSLLALIFAIAKLLFTKDKKDKKIAFIPFLNVAFLLVSAKEILHLGRICW